MPSRICPGCNIEKDYTEYHPSKHAKSGIYPRCRKCVNAYRAKFRKERGDKLRERERNYIARDREKHNAKSRKWYHNRQTEEQRQAILRRQRFRLNCWTEEYLAEYKKTHNSLCANLNCGREATCMDHNHKTKTPRAMLCQHCNFALGLLRENPMVIQGIKDYAEKWNCDNYECEKSTQSSAENA